MTINVTLPSHRWMSDRGSPGASSFVRHCRVENRIPHLGSHHLCHSRSNHSSAQARAIGVDDVSCQGVAAGVFGGVEDHLDDLIRKAGVPGNRLACSAKQDPRVPCDQLDEQVVTIGEVAVDTGPRQSNLTRNVVHRGLADAVAINAAFSGGQDALARIVCTRRCGWLTGRSSRHIARLLGTSVVR